MNKKLNLKEPKYYNEKLQWLKLNIINPEYTTYVDKYAVRKHIEKKIGHKYLIPLIGVFDQVSDIPWDDLPNKFVLKCTHSSTTNIICSDKNLLDVESAKRKLSKWMKTNYFWYGREWPYKKVVPKIVCEAYLGDEKNVPCDYKVSCFNGKAKLIDLHQNRFTDKHSLDYYDIDWTLTDISKKIIPNSRQSAEKPSCYDEMISLSELLAADFKFLRVDWYVVENKLYFGEMTIYPGAGFNGFVDERDELLLGSWIDLNP
ncbi:MAG: glycosyl transferase [Clostridiales bacterium]|nr:glycosyl transferase [Clostridiales bacterium]